MNTTQEIKRNQWILIKLVRKLIINQSIFCILVQGFEMECVDVDISILPTIIRNVMCCKLNVLQIERVSNCVCFKMHMLQNVCVANCKCCKLQVMQRQVLFWKSICRRKFFWLTLSQKNFILYMKMEYIITDFLCILLQKEYTYILRCALLIWTYIS